MCGFGGAEGENTIVYCVDESVTGAEVGHVSFLPLLAEPLSMRRQPLVLDLPTTRLVRQDTAKKRASAPCHQADHSGPHGRYPTIHRLKIPHEG